MTIVSYIVGPGNGSPIAANVVVDLLGTFYQIVNVLNFHFARNHNYTSAADWLRYSRFLHCARFLC